MPTLFISYKRGTAAIQPLRDRLHAAKYRTWYDGDDIPVGDNWRLAIDLGIDHADGLLVGLTGAACNSEYVQYEVNRARDKHKPIFPVKMEAFDEAALSKLGLTDQQYSDFTKAESGAWDRAFEKLLEGLIGQGLRVTRHDLRRQRDLDNPTYTLHQRYLRRLVEGIGTLNLAQIDPNGYSVELERVYIDQPTPLAISVEIKDWHVVDWWFDDREKLNEIVKPGDDPRKGVAAHGYEARRTPEQIGLERAPLLVRIGELEQRIERYRAENPKAKPDDQRWRNHWNNGGHENAIALTINDVAAARDRLVVLAGPGSGKSTFVRYLALCLAGAQINEWRRPARLEQLGVWPHGPLTPVYVELRRFVASAYYPANLNQNPTTAHLWAYIKAELLGEELAAYAPDLALDLEHGYAVLILDGLDEVPFPERKLADRQRQLRELATSLNTGYQDSRIIVASRPRAYEHWILPDYTAVTLSDFNDNHRIELAGRLYQAAGLAEAEAAQKAQALNRQLGSVHPELKDRPLFLTLMATIFLRNGEQGLPTRKGALYRQSILLLLDRWTQSKPNALALSVLLGGATVEDLYERLSALAYHVHAQFGERPGAPEIDKYLISKHLDPLGNHVAVDLIHYLSENAAVLVSPGQNATEHVFHFAHRTFQEYLAACQIAGACIQADSYDAVRALIQTKPQLWREPGRLIGDALTDGGHPSHLWALLGDLLGDGLSAGTSEDDPRWWAVWLAAQIAEEQGLLIPLPTRPRDKLVCDILRNSLVALLETPQALLPPERSACGRVLSLVGDPRPGVGLRLDGLLPDIAWCKVPAGEFIMGSEAHENEKPIHTLTLPTFHISKDPITYQQFQAFVDAPDGYDDSTWWDGLHADGLKQWQDGPGDHRFKFSNHPRANVSWYDAMAFCRWLTAKLHTGLLPSPLGEGPGVRAEIRLPTEEEWEKAARGTDGRVYPYGNEYHSGKGNTVETGICQTSAVGIFPDGASPYEVLDMSGNVWEWTLTEYNSKSSIELSNSQARVLRGGSWRSNQDFARAAYRVSNYPVSRDDNIGFRVVVFAPAPER